MIISLSKICSSSKRFYCAPRLNNRFLFLTKVHLLRPVDQTILLQRPALSSHRVNSLNNSLEQSSFLMASNPHLLARYEEIPFPWIDSVSASQPANSHSSQGLRINNIGDELEVQVARDEWVVAFMVPHEAPRTRSRRGSPLAGRAELSYGPTKLKAHDICPQGQTVRRSRRWVLIRDPRFRDRESSSKCRVKIFFESKERARGNSDSCRVKDRVLVSFLAGVRGIFNSLKNLGIFRIEFVHFRSQNFTKHITKNTGISNSTESTFAETEVEKQEIEYNANCFEY